MSTRQYICILTALLLLSCKKQDDWLNVKQENSHVLPKSLSDFQRILDNSFGEMNINYATSGLIGSDNLYITDENIDVLYAVDRNSYLWNKDIFENGNSGELAYAYMNVNKANIVLDGLTLDHTADLSPREFDNIKGQALFFRAFSFYNLANLFS